MVTKLAMSPVAEPGERKKERGKEGRKEEIRKQTEDRS